ncbi:hypothetical protein ACJMK2_023195 [Sinanodonta woodiana]|uniref:C-mannosyltransferase DPY19L1 n=1 Tax=Sinanodonta woodiana TaxID=1069815 RepID=A0ABD3T3E6_SINWO
MAAKSRKQISSSNHGASSSNKGNKRVKHDEDNFTSKRNAILYKGLIVIIAIGVGVLHRNHVAGMFERDRHFSHLSTLERELAFRTEMGLYYSYYKTIIEAPAFSDGLISVMYDNITEYPLTINVLKRFNLYPEVVLAAGYRTYEAISAAMKRPTKMCWSVNRGEGMPPVLSCEGLGEPAYFYIEAVFALNGLMMSIFFLFGTYLSGSIFGGVLVVCSFFYNHGECTRVQWTPPLRESFAYPFLVMQMFLVTHIIRMKAPTKLHSLLLAFATVCFMLPWQFAQFALLTQTVAVFATYVLGFIGSHKMYVFLTGQVSGFLISYILLFGNEMLLTSFFCSCLITVTLIVLLEPFLEALKIRVVIWGLQGILLGVGTLGIKLVIAKALQVADDAHIADIFRSKFTDFKNFHTMLYTCAAEFDFMEAETPWRVLKTLLAPSVIVVIGTVIVQLLIREYASWNSEKKETVENGQKSLDENRKYRSKPDAEIVYHIFQLLAFTAMAIIIMRLKLFWTPHMCLMTSLLASRQFFSWMGKTEKHFTILAALLACMSYQGIFFNLQHQWSIMGEFSNYPLEQLVEWIKAETPPNAVFAGPMPTMATVKLCAGRPIVNHPHYEDAGLRERTKKVYTMYSRKPEEEVKQNLLDLQVDYVIMEDSWCIRKTRQAWMWNARNLGHRR